MIFLLGEKLKGGKLILETDYSALSQLITFSDPGFSFE